MKWEKVTLVEDETVSVRLASLEDFDTEVRLDVLCFGEDEAAAKRFTEQIKQENLQETYMIETNGKTVGKIRVSIMHGEAWIYGFAVFPEYQGKGIGKKALSIVVLKEHKAGHSIFLEVEAKNANALRLYESCGFKAFHSQDYYEYLG
jgi:ribosomal protein S18 acetylase RimI-like enzyme